MYKNSQSTILFAAHQKGYLGFRMLSVWELEFLPLLRRVVD